MYQTVLLVANRSNERTIAELAVQILSEEWPLPLKTIKRKLNKEHGKQASCQATHKALKKLVKEKILLKKKKLYSIRPDWLEELNEFAFKTKQGIQTEHRMAKTTNSL